MAAIEAVKMKSEPTLKNSVAFDGNWIQTAKAPGILIKTMQQKKFSIALFRYNFNKSGRENLNEELYYLGVAVARVCDVRSDA